MKKYILISALFLIVSQTGYAELSVGNVQASGAIAPYAKQIEASKKLIESNNLSWDELIQLYKTQYQNVPAQTIQAEVASTERKLSMLGTNAPESLKLKAKIEALNSLIH